VVRQFPIVCKGVFSGINSKIRRVGEAGITSFIEIRQRIVIDQFSIILSGVFRSQNSQIGFVIERIIRFLVKSA
jgi:hypothetical protein